MRTEVTRTGDAQIRNARAAEAEMKRKVDAYGLENDRLREANDALQQQLRTAQSAGDGAVKSMREVESAYAALEGEVTRVKASLTREQEEHAATKRSLQRTVNELKESGDAKEALAARARTLENEAREAEQRATYAEAEANEWRGRGRAAEAAVKDGEALHQQQVQRAAMSVDSMTEELHEARRVREAIEHELTKTREALDRATMEARDASRMAQTHHAKYEAALTDEQRNLAHWRSEFDRISLVSDDQATEIRSLTDRVLTAEDRVAHLTHALDQARRQVVEDARVHEHQVRYDPRSLTLTLVLTLLYTYIQTRLPLTHTFPLPSPPLLYPRAGPGAMEPGDHVTERPPPCPRPGARGVGAPVPRGRERIGACPSPSAHGRTGSYPQPRYLRDALPLPLLPNRYRGLRPPAFPARAPLPHPRRRQQTRRQERGKHVRYLVPGDDTDRHRRHGPRGAGHGCAQQSSQVRHSRRLPCPWRPSRTASTLNSDQDWG